VSFDAAEHQKDWRFPSPRLRRGGVLSVASSSALLQIAVELDRMNMDPVLTTVLLALGTALGFFLKPFAEKLVEKHLNKKPMFSFRPMVLRENLEIEVKCENRQARKRKPLGVIFDGSIIGSIGSLKVGDGDIAWNVNLVVIDGFIESIKEKSSAEIQFFIDSNNPSDKYKIYIENKEKIVDLLSGKRERSAPVDAGQLIESFGSGSTIILNRKIINISSGFPKKTENVSWSPVFDGKEICITDVRDLNIIGQASSILADPQYAWVIRFRDCHNISLRDLTFGHTVEGYCQGGVLIFEACSGISVDNCELYGSGTYGLKFEGCGDVNVTNSVIRDCSYGIFEIIDTHDILFSKCRFENNRQFDLCIFEGDACDVMINSCEFVGNISSGFVFNTDKLSSDSRISLWNNHFHKNKFNKFASDYKHLSEHENRHA
jgi:hypothetical protein